MTIISSTSIVGHAQADGRRYVVETHTDHLGQTYTREYLAPVGADYVAIRTNYAVRLAEDLAQREFEGLIGGA